MGPFWSGFGRFLGARWEGFGLCCSIFTLHFQPSEFLLLWCSYRISKSYAYAGGNKVHASYRQMGTTIEVARRALIDGTLDSRIHQAALSVEASLHQDNLSLNTKNLILNNNRPCFEEAYTQFSSSLDHVYSKFRTSVDQVETMCGSILARVQTLCRSSSHPG